MYHIGDNMYMNIIKTFLSIIRLLLLPSVSVRCDSIYLIMYQYQTHQRLNHILNTHGCVGFWGCLYHPKSNKNLARAGKLRDMGFCWVARKNGQNFAMFRDFCPKSSDRH